MTCRYLTANVRKRYIKKSGDWLLEIPLSLLQLRTRLIGNYRRLIQQSSRTAFDKEVDTLWQEVKTFQESAKEQLNEAINWNCN